MADNGNRSPMEWLRSHYDEEELTCPDCGYEDEEGSWVSETNGKQVHYFHECPACDAVREHTIRLADN